MGAGKSTIAKRLSYQLGCRLIDMDAYIVSKSGRTIPQIFKEEGEAAFRTMEREAAREIVARYNTPEEKKLDANGNEYVTLVLSLGGGALTGSETAQVIKENTMCVYLKCSVELLLQRLSDGHSERPLIMNKSREELREYIASTLALRNPSYIGNSRIIVECDGKSAADICNEIIGHLE